MSDKKYRHAKITYLIKHYYGLKCNQWWEKDFANANTHNDFI